MGDALQQIAGIPDAKLIDAHSFCWMLVQLEGQETDAAGSVRRQSPDRGRVLGARERSIADMKYSVLHTVQQSRGQLEERRVKIKELRMSEYELDAIIRELVKKQEDCCALTGLPFHSEENTQTRICCLRSIGKTAADTTKRETCRWSAGL